jgi:type IV secretory pathway protease TraF
MQGELFLLNSSHPASFDSRYFGPLDRSFVIGKAVPLWTFASP